MIVSKLMMQTSENEVTDDVLVSFACALETCRISFLVFYVCLPTYVPYMEIRTNPTIRSVLVKKRNVKLQIKTVVYKETSDVEPVP